MSSSSSLGPAPAAPPVDPSAVSPEAVLSAEELALLQQKFAFFNPHSNKARSLSSAHAIRLFRDDFPTLSEWEIADLLQRCDLNCDGQLSLPEYLHARAFHKLLVEAQNDHEVQRSFTVLDLDGDGVLRADDVLLLLDQARDSTARVLRQAIRQAADATRRASEDSACGLGRPQSSSSVSSRRGPATPRDGEITLPCFLSTVRAVNRQLEQEIAAKSLRLLELETRHAALTPDAGSHALAQRESLEIEMDVLRREVARTRRELITDANRALSRVCETLIATFENEQHVYESLRTLLGYCGVRDATLLRRRLEQAGRAVHVLDAQLLAPTPQQKRSPHFEALMDLSLGGSTACSGSAMMSSTPLPSARSVDTSAERPTAAGANWATRWLASSTLRRHFVFYTMAGNVTNLESMTRSSFVRFVKDCRLHESATPPMVDAEINNIFARCSKREDTSGMTFPQWVCSFALLWRRQAGEPCPPAADSAVTDAHTMETFIKTRILPYARQIKSQNIAPDVSQTHVLKLLREHLWPLKQIFFHFAGRSLAEVDASVTLEMTQFLAFARAFQILRASTERDGEPYTPPPLSENPSIRPISLMELVREWYAAKLDVSFSNPWRRDAHDLSFREFLRCLQRVALAMHVPNPRRRQDVLPPNGILSTSFEALKEDDSRGAQRAHTPLYHRRGNVLGVSPAKNCKMTSTSVISRLLQTSRAMASAGASREEDASSGHASEPSPRASVSRSSPTRIIYGAPSITTPGKPKTPSKRPPRRPVGCGGAPRIRVVRPPEGAA
ncbi:hypothetical protein P43SY_003147 [Pythium insidiosum]|uniref:EF-hand domain-containing protein n=1 Tax=Pythium insidiosum TaxID=114742 RepID=A0AAD5LVU7_PYTIN|nr:hypothetical protein P43SY_003147 [Pythium insidiosum]